MYVLKAINAVDISFHPVRRPDVDRCLVALHLLCQCVPTVTGVTRSAVCEKKWCDFRGICVHSRLSLTKSQAIEVS